MELLCALCVCVCLCRLPKAYYDPTVGRHKANGCIKGKKKEEWPAVEWLAKFIPTQVGCLAHGWGEKLSSHPGNKKAAAWWREEGLSGVPSTWDWDHSWRSALRWRMDTLLLLLFLPFDHPTASPPYLLLQNCLWYTAVTATRPVFSHSRQSGGPNTFTFRQVRFSWRSFHTRSTALKAKQSRITRIIKDKSSTWTSNISHSCSPGLKVQSQTVHPVFLGVCALKKHVISESGMSPTSTGQQQHRSYWPAADKCPSRCSRFTYTKHTDTAAEAIERCVVISARLLFKAAGRQLILIRVDRAGGTTTNQLIYSREQLHEPVTLSTLKSLQCREEMMSASESSLITNNIF